MNLHQIRAPFDYGDKPEFHTIYIAACYHTEDFYEQIEEYQTDLTPDIYSVYGWNDKWGSELIEDFDTYGEVLAYAMGAAEAWGIRWNNDVPKRLRV
jgi:hypothetical protein